VLLEKDGDQLNRSCKKEEEILHRVKEDRNILHTTEREKANWIGHSLRRNCLLKQVIKCNTEGRM
jgi:hypothetical protein